MKKQFKLLSWMLLLAMLLGIMPPQLSVYAEQADKTLSQVAAKVTQKGSDIKPGDSIDPEADLSVRVSFDLPELVGESANLVQDGDTVSIKLTDAFTLVSDNSVSLMNGDVSVGRVTFNTNADTQMVIANIVFDQAKPILVEALENKTFNFSIKFKYNTSGDAGKPGDHSVKVLEEKYRVAIIPAEPVESTQPEATQPIATQPEATQPEVTQPEVTQPVVIPSTKPAGTAPTKPAKLKPSIQSEVLSSLENVVKVISQNGVVVPANGNLTSTDPIKVAISFDVPVLGDELTPANPVIKGDTAVFVLSSAFKVPTPNSLVLKQGTINVGHVTFSTNGLGEVIATVLFDGDDEVFNGTSNTVKAEFNADFEYNNDGSAGTAGDHIIKILDKDYTVKVPAPPIEFKVYKSGVADLTTGKITWTATVTATQGGEPIDLKDYKFSDDLTNVGPFVAGSFKVDGTTVVPVTAGKTISYVFPVGSMSPQEIKFTTDIPTAKLYASSAQTITNKAQLYEGIIWKSEGSGSVKFTPNWITKTGATNDTGSGGVYDPTNRTITWTITANLGDLALNSVVIKDVLPTGLNFDSATMQTWNGTTWNAASAITPNATGEYAIGNINKRVLLTIVTKVPDSSYEAGVTTFKNTANMTWDGSIGEGPGTGAIGVGIGYNAISKIGAHDTKTGIINWTMNVNTKGQTIPALKAYDLLIYGSVNQNLATVTGIPVGVDRSKLVQQLNQKYIVGSFTGSGLTVTVIPIFQGGNRVGDLLEISGFSMTQPNPFTIKTQVLNPDIFAGNKPMTVKNTITLHSAGTKINQAEASVAYKSQVLSKEMLKREATLDPANGVNTQITKDANAAFNYVDKSVIFRLTVNADAMDLTNMIDAAGLPLGMVTLTDTLPAGWEFVNLIGSDKYQIFEGGKSGTTVNALDTTPDTVTGLTANFSGETATFTFNPLNKPYVILVRARPTTALAADYFNGNKTTTVNNTLALKSENWLSGPSVKQDVTINSTILSKIQTKVEDGVLNWSVEYRPYDMTGSATRIDDLIPNGLALRTDANGNLLLAGNITVTEMTLNTNGTYTDAGQVTLVQGSNIFYNNTTRILSFKIPNSAKAYRLNYITDITGEPGTIKNKAILYGSDSELVDTSVSYVISSADGSASLKRNGWIEISKQDGSKKALAGVEFTLFSSDG
ncbi:MAG: hypothetical protein WAV55_08000, partial [Clostridiaceae bacterium]